MDSEGTRIGQNDDVSDHTDRFTGVKCGQRVFPGAHDPSISLRTRCSVLCWLATVFCVAVPESPSHADSTAEIGSREHLLSSLKSAFDLHLNETGTVASTWSGLKQYLFPSKSGNQLRIEEYLGKRIDHAYILLDRPTPINHADLGGIVLLERIAAPHPHTNARVRYAITYSDQEGFAEVVIPASVSNDLVAAAIAAGGENKPVPVKTAREIPPPPIATSPEHRTRRYLKFPLWLAFLAIIVVIGITLWRSVRRDANRENGPAPIKDE